MFREKAGIDLSKKNEIEKVIDECTKNTKFSLRLKKQREKIEKDSFKLLKDCENFTDEEISQALKICDKIFIFLEEKFQKTIKHKKIIAHLDMDAFYAQIEELDDLNLKTLPMAVGGMSMLATSNYEARKYGVRAAMPGFIAKKLCPELIIINPNFSKYKSASNIIHEILKKYDPYLISVGLDEAYMDFSNKISPNNLSVESIEKLILAIKEDIINATKLTCTIGVSISCLLSKICSNVKKPNGHFILLQDNLIKYFIAQQPVGRINGVGNVTETHLNTIGVKYCKDIFENRAKIYLIFGKKRALWLFHASLGLDEDLNEYNECKNKQNTIGVERTFIPTSSEIFILKNVDELSNQVSNLLKDNVLFTNNITLKIKFDDFHSITRSYTLTCLTDSYEIIRNVAIELFKKELSQNISTKIRLIGLRVTKIKQFQNKNFQSSTLDKYFSPKSLKKNQKTNQVECPICNIKLKNNTAIINKHIDNCLKDNKDYIF